VTLLAGQDEIYVAFRPHGTTLASASGWAITLWVTA
jgi:hypothetical protein